MEAPLNQKTVTVTTPLSERPWRIHLHGGIPDLTPEQSAAYIRLQNERSTFLPRGAGIDAEIALLLDVPGELVLLTLAGRGMDPANRARFAARFAEHLQRLEGEGLVWSPLVDAVARSWPAAGVPPLAEWLARFEPWLEHAGLEEVQGLSQTFGARELHRHLTGHARLTTLTPEQAKGLRTRYDRAIEDVLANPHLSREAAEVVLMEQLEAPITSTTHYSGDADSSWKRQKMVKEFGERWGGFTPEFRERALRRALDGQAPAPGTVAVRRGEDPFPARQMIDSALEDPALTREQLVAIRDSSSRHVSDSARARAIMHPLTTPEERDERVRALPRNSGVRWALVDYPEATRAMIEPLSYDGNVVTMNSFPKLVRHPAAGPGIWAMALDSKSPDVRLALSQSAGARRWAPAREALERSSRTEILAELLDGAEGDDWLRLFHKVARADLKLALARLVELDLPEGVKVPVAWVRPALTHPDREIREMVGRVMGKIQGGAEGLSTTTPPRRRRTR